jgi:hypothetical protein
MHLHVSLLDFVLEVTSASTVCSRLRVAFEVVRLCIDIDIDVPLARDLAAMAAEFGVGFLCLLKWNQKSRGYMLRIARGSCSQDYNWSALDVAPRHARGFAVYIYAEWFSLALLAVRVGDI